MNQILGISWKPELRAVADLKKWDKNPRTITDDAYARLKRKVTEEGMHQVLTIDTDNTVLSGNQRLSVLTEVGVAEVWCMVPERALNEQERDKVGIQSNIIEGLWDTDILANQFEVPMLLDQGFTKLQLGMEALSEDDFDAEEEYEKIDEPVSKLGDIYKLGQHRIMCGDSTSLEDVEKLMGGVRARLFFTDPPYGVNYMAGITKGNKLATKKHTKIANDDLEGAALRDFLLKCFLNAFAVTTDDAAFYSWFANSTHQEFKTAMESAGWRYSQIIVWIKQRFVLSRSDYHHSFEPCMYGWKEGQKHFSNPKMRSFSDVLALDVDTFADQLDVWFINRDNMQEYKHPTQKPVRLSERALRMNTEHGDSVLDLFLGSGSTLIGAAQAGRICYGMELDPKYIDLVVKRYLRAYPDANVECITNPSNMALIKA